MNTWRQQLKQLWHKIQKATEEPEGCGRCAVCHHVCDILKDPKNHKPQAMHSHGAGAEEE